MYALRSTRNSELTASTQPAPAAASTPSFYDQARKAGDDILVMLRAAYSDASGRLRAADAISAAAGLAGEFALRASGVPLPGEGALVAGGVADGVLFADVRQPTVWSMLTRAVQAVGEEADQLPDLAEITARTLDSVGQTAFPPYTIPQAYRPSEW